MPSNALRKYLDRASATYHEQLRINGRSLAGATQYLADHGILEWRIAEKYMLGYVAEPLPGDEQFAGCISVPYLSPNGVTAMKYRSLGNDSRKYNGLRGQKTRLYNPAAYFEAGDVVGVTEGEVDAIAATERIGIPSVGVPGASNWLPIWTPLFRDFQHVLLFADGDEPGRAWAARASDEVGWRARIVQCPDGEDVSSMVASGRAEELQKLASTSNDEDG